MLWSVESVERRIQVPPHPRSNSIATIHSPQRRVSDFVLDTRMNIFINPHDDLGKVTVIFPLKRGNWGPESY